MKEKNIRTEELLASFGLVDQELLDEAFETDSAEKFNSLKGGISRKTAAFLRVAAVAACFVLVFGSLLFLPALLEPNDGFPGVNTSPIIPGTDPTTDPSTGSNIVPGTDPIIPGTDSSTVGPGTDVPIIVPPEPILPPNSSLYTGMPDISWYGYFDAETALPVPNDPSATEYHITTADQLAGFSVLVGFYFIEFEDVTIYLETDIIWNTGVFTVDENGNPLYNGIPIDTSNEEAHKAGSETLKFFNPIGDRDQAVYETPQSYGQFYGSFDGQGHVISGLYVNDDLNYAGLFVYFCGKELKDVSIVNSYFSADSRSGSFAGFVYNAYECGENRDIVGSRFSGLYSNAYIVSTGKNAGNNARSGGIVGMVRPRKIIDGQDPVAKGTITVFEDCWFDGAIIFYDANCRYSGGIIGVAGLDSTTNAIPQSEVIIKNCLMTGSFMNYGKTDVEIDRTEGMRVGSLVGNIYKGKLTLENCIVAMRDTNITAENGYRETDANGAVLPGKAPVGTLENDPSQVVYKNVFIKAKGLFRNATSVITIAEAERDFIGIEGEYTTDDDLSQALAALGTNASFDLSDLSEPKLKGVRTALLPLALEGFEKLSFNIGEASSGVFQMYASESFEEGDFPIADAILQKIFVIIDRQNWIWYRSMPSEYEKCSDDGHLSVLRKLMTKTENDIPQDIGENVYLWYVIDFESGKIKVCRPELSSDWSHYVCILSKTDMNELLSLIRDYLNNGK